MAPALDCVRGCSDAAEPAEEADPEHVENGYQDPSPHVTDDTPAVSHHNYASRMPGPGDLWSFPSGLIGTHDSVKGYAVEAADGPAGKVSWASYAPGESYLVVTFRRHLHETHHVIPAGAVQTVDAAQRKVWLRMTRADVERAPEHHDPVVPLDGAKIDSLAGLWPTWLAGSGE